MTNARELVLVLESGEPERLAQFYSQLLDAEVQVEPDLAHLRVQGPHGTHLMIRRNEGMVPTVWPQSSVTSQGQVRLSVPAGELDEVERRIVGLGGQPLDIESEDDNLTFADPDGHPFALVAEK